MILLFYFIFFIYFLVMLTESEVQEIKQCTCQVQVKFKAIRPAAAIRPAQLLDG